MDQIFLKGALFQFNLTEIEVMHCKEISDYFGLFQRQIWFHVIASGCHFTKILGFTSSFFSYKSGLQSTSVLTSL